MWRYEKEQRQSAAISALLESMSEMEGINDKIQWIFAGDLGANLLDC